MMGDFLYQKRGHKQLVVHSCLSVDSEMERVRFPQDATDASSEVNVLHWGLIVAHYDALQSTAPRA